MAEFVDSSGINQCFGRHTFPKSVMPTGLHQSINDLGVALLEVTIISCHKP